MSEQYFERVRQACGSRFWVNNPTGEEMDLALQYGAMGCTTNPAYGGGLVKRSPAEVLPVVHACLGISEDDRLVAEEVQRRLVGRICERFLPLYGRTAGQEGFVSIQGDPEADTDAAAILAEARLDRTIAPNVTPKIPATAPGLAAFETIVAEGSQAIVTEVFSVAQVIDACERWLTVTDRTGTRPPFIMSPITGIFGDHLRKVARRDGIDVPEAALEVAGVLLARACYRVVREREYPVLLLYGGARIPLDFSGLVGGGMAATINWSTAAELIAADMAVELTVEDGLDPALEQALVSAFPEVRQALEPQGLTVEEFEDFGPVQHFRSNFIAGWHGVLEMIAAERAAVSA